MTEALIGLAGILIGLLINEHFRKANRIENYSSRIFDKRLEIYEELMRLVDEKSSLVTEVVENPELTKEEAHSICQPAGLEVMEYCDANQLYLNEEITVHIGATFVGIADIIDSDDDEYKQTEIQRFRQSVGSAKQMIKSESGIEELNQLFKKITKAKHTSPIIEYLRELKKNKV